MFAITQTEYYLGLLKYLCILLGTVGGSFIFFGVVYGVLFYSRYWK